MERLTLDMTAIRDIMQADRARHAEGLKLLKLANNGDLEFAIPPQGRRADLRDEYLAVEMRDLLTKSGVIELPQLARPSSVTFPGQNLVPGYVVGGFGEAWDAIAAKWNGPGHLPKEFDRWYVESHIADGRDVLITDDEGLHTMCDRLRAEHGLAVRAEGLSEYVPKV
jgi:hypothetical protein